MNLEVMAACGPERDERSYVCPSRTIREQSNDVVADEEAVRRRKENMERVGERARMVGGSGRCVV